MHDQRIPDEPPRRHLPEEKADLAVLSFIINEAVSPWSVDEIARQLGDQTDATDAIRRLTECGLLHRLGDFVFPTRTARRAAEIEVGTV